MPVNCLLHLLLQYQFSTCSHVQWMKSPRPYSLVKPLSSLLSSGFDDRTYYFTKALKQAYFWLTVSIFYTKHHFDLQPVVATWKPITYSSGHSIYFMVLLTQAAQQNQALWQELESYQLLLAQQHVVFSVVGNFRKQRNHWVHMTKSHCCLTWHASAKSYQLQVHAHLPIFIAAPCSHALLFATTDICTCMSFHACSCACSIGTIENASDIST